MVSSHQLNPKNNGLVLLFKTVFRDLNCFLLSVTADDKDGNGLRLEKIRSGLSSFSFALHDKLHLRGTF